MTGLWRNGLKLHIYVYTHTHTQTATQTASLENVPPPWAKFWVCSLFPRLPFLFSQCSMQCPEAREEPRTVFLHWFAPVSEYIQQWPLIHVCLFLQFCTGMIDRAMSPESLLSRCLNHITWSSSADAVGSLVFEFLTFKFLFFFGQLFAHFALKVEFQSSRPQQSHLTVHLAAVLELSIISHDLHLQLMRMRSAFNVDKNVLKERRTNGNLDMSVRQSPPADEDHEIWSTAPEQLLNGPWGSFLHCQSQRWTVKLHQTESFKIRNWIKSHSFKFPPAAPSTCIVLRDTAGGGIELDTSETSSGR